MLPPNDISKVAGPSIKILNVLPVVKFIVVLSRLGIVRPTEFVHRLAPAGPGTPCGPVSPSKPCTAKKFQSGSELVGADPPGTIGYIQNYYLNKIQHHLQHMN